MSSYLLVLAGLALGLSACTSTRPQPPGSATYRYSVSLRHLVRGRLPVRVELPPPVPGAPAVFVLPKVVPGIYGNLNFGQYVADFATFDQHNRPLAVAHPDTNSWVIADAARLHHLTYTVAPTWREFRSQLGRPAPFYRSAGSSYHPDSAFVLNYGTFAGYLDGQPPRPYEVRFARPAGFYGASYLTPQPLNDTTEVVQAASYRELVDAPVLYARPDTAWLQLGATRVLVAYYDGASRRPEAPALARSLRAQLAAQRDYLGGTLPVDKYVFLVYHTTGARGRQLGDGLEHSHSTLSLFESADVQRLPEAVQHIAAHEFFHIVTPLNIHAEQIEHYDFRNPRFSEHLWLYEGLTEYETIHMPIREKLETLAQFAEVLTGKARAMSRFDDTLALTRLSQQVVARQDQFYNFYLKGALFNLCLDVRLRELSGGTVGTQQLVQRLLRRYGPHQPFRDDELFNVITALTYPDVRTFFRRYAEQGRPLPLAETLAKVGFTYDSATRTVGVVPDPTAAQLALRQAWLGQ